MLSKRGVTDRLPCLQATKLRDTVAAMTAVIKELDPALRAALDPSVQTAEGALEALAEAALPAVETLRGQAEQRGCGDGRKSGG